jgi:hypothetical protein
MKTKTQVLLSAVAVLGFTACDQAKDAATQAADKAKAAATEAADKAKAATAEAVDKAKAEAPDLKSKLSAAAAEAKAAGADALAKGGDMLDTAKAWGLEKMGVPEADGLLEGFGKLIEEGRAAVASGMNSEKATALKAKWDEQYAKASEAIKTMAPEQQEKMKAILAKVKAKWDEMLTKADGSVQ